ncbi:MAG: DUF11 domain-containing protein [Candidatus Kerfeldbacteria bacterium]|nr:DUF11 domain-containing protein [Candidatus Kerfeldbacteria bacterium]
MSKKKKVSTATTANVDHHDELIKLYQNDHTQGAVDMTTLERRTTTARKPIGLLVLAIMVLSLVATALGYIVFGASRPGVSSSDVIIALAAPAAVASGDEVALTITYTNNSSVAIDHGDIELVLPAGFYLRSAQPQPNAPNTTSWSVSQLPAGASATIDFTGQLVGQKGDSKDFTVLFTYQPVNFSSDFQTSSHISMQLNDSIMKVAVTAPEQARTGEVIDYVFTVTNTASLPLTNVKAYVQYPDTFSPSSADPSATQSNHTWVFDQIDQNSSVTVTVSGDLAAKDGSTEEFIVQLGLLEPDGFFNVQAETSTIITVINPELRLQLNAPEFVSPGETIDYDITIENTSTVSLDDVTLQLEFSGEAVDSAAVTLEAIDELKSNQTATLGYQLVVPNTAIEDASTITATLAVMSAHTADIPVSFEQIATVTTTLSGSLTAASFGRYYDDDLTKLGSGPTPPQVGETTTYTIRWLVTATGSTMENITMTASLPDTTTFIDTDDNRLSYNASDRSVTFTLKSVDSGVTKQADFSVSITPSKGDVNKLVVLVNEAIVTATDQATDQPMQTQTDQVTTKLNTDPAATDDGVVVESN